MTANIPFFSVVIPAYNCASFIERALESVRNQTFKDYEIVVVNDGSTDSTPEIIQIYIDSHPEIQVILINQSNKGIGGARNTGIKNANGKYVAFLDADDLWYPEKLEKVAEIFKRNPDVVLVCHDEYMREEGGITRKSLRYGPCMEPMYEWMLFSGNCISTSATAVKREALLNAGLFSENLEFNGVEDYELWLRLAKNNCKFYFLHETLGEYIRVEGSISTKVEYHCQNIINVLDAHFEAYGKENRLFKMYKQRKSNILYSAGREYHRQRKYRKALQYYIKSLRQNPLNVKTSVAIILALLGIKK